MVFSPLRHGRYSYRGGTVGSALGTAPWTPEVWRRRSGAPNREVTLRIWVPEAFPLGTIWCAKYTFHCEAGRQLDVAWDHEGVLAREAVLAGPSESTSVDKRREIISLHIVIFETRLGSPCQCKCRAAHSLFVGHQLFVVIPDEMVHVQSRGNPRSIPAPTRRVHPRTVANKLDIPLHRPQS